MPTRQIPQYLFKGAAFEASKLTIDAAGVSDDDEDDWQVSFGELLGDAPPLIGISALFDPITCTIRYLAFASPSRIFVIKVPTTDDGGIASFPHDSDYDTLCETLGGGKDGSILVGFNLVQLALALHREGNYELQGVDLGIVGPAPGALPGRIIQNLFKDDALGNAYGRIFGVPPIENEEDNWRKETEWVALRAWMAVMAAGTNVPLIQKTPPVSTKPTENLSLDDLEILAEVHLQYDKLDAAAPETRGTDVASWRRDKEGKLELLNEAFKSKIRKGSQQTVVVEYSDGRRMEGFVTKTKGKKTQINIEGDIPEVVDPEAVEEGAEEAERPTITTIGPDDLTTADVARTVYLLDVLQGTKTVRGSDFTRMIWFPDEDDIERLEKTNVKPDEDSDPDDSTGETQDQAELEIQENVIQEMRLNESQAKVARTMISDNHKFALVHGPPGTGKTMTIAAVVKAWFQMKKPVYLVAQSNVGVKNIAEKLAKTGTTDFKLLVSSEFYEEWHENIYDKCKPNLVQSSDFRGEVKNIFKGVPIILSTVNMLYNSTLGKERLFDIVPLERVVVDEASQIYIGDYMALFYRFRQSLKKVCWFGDPRQLPPHQREQIEGLKSIYDVSHIIENSLLLDTQYRMPCPIGDFISKDRYEGKLKSSHAINELSCVKLIDVYAGQESQQGTSWINEQEAEVVADLVLNYYSEKPYCVITPYDSQRKVIEKKLSDKGIQGKGKCFNVDSFQGNEEEYVIISTVRTDATGFLDLNNRVNVMLTRAQKGMIIVTNQRFLELQARMTLIGKLADAWISRLGGQDYADQLWVDPGEVKARRADMPGAPGSGLRKPPVPKPDVEDQFTSPSGFEFAAPKVASVPPRQWGARPMAPPTATPQTAWGSPSPAVTSPLPLAPPGLVAIPPSQSTAASGPKIPRKTPAGPKISPGPLPGRTGPKPVSPASAGGAWGSGSWRSPAIPATTRALNQQGSTSGGQVKGGSKPAKSAWGKPAGPARA